MNPRISSSEAFTFSGCIFPKFRMLKIGTCLLLALSAWSLWEGSLADHLQSGHVCLIDEPHPNQCESFCLNALRPLLIETKAKLDGQEGQQVKMEERLEAKLRDQHQAVQNKIEGKLQAVQSKVEEVQAKLERSLVAVQNRLEAKLEDQHRIQVKLETNLVALQSRVEGQHAVLSKIEGQLQTIINKIKPKKVVYDYVDL